MTVSNSLEVHRFERIQPIKVRFRLVGFELLTNTSRRHICKRESLSVLRLTYVFIILIKFPPKKLRAAKVEQLNFFSENVKEIFPPQLPGRKYVTESSLGIVVFLLFSLYFGQKSRNRKPALTPGYVFPKCNS